MSAAVIRPVTLADAPAIADIYSYYILHSIATFETEPIGAAEMTERIVTAVPDYPYLVLEQDGAVIGYSCVSPWKPRAAFYRSGEASIYLHHDHTRQGHGTRLFSALLERAADYDLHCLISGISLPNPGSEALHRQVGFTHAGLMREIGHKFDRYIDIAYYQYLNTDAT